MGTLLSKIVMMTALLGSGDPSQDAKPVPIPPATPVVIPLSATIDGPTVVTLGTPAVFTIKGVPAEHLDKFNWQVFNKPADAMVLDLADRAGNPVMMFWSRTSGKCAVIADVNVPPNQFQLIVHEFTVGNPQPDPKPDPDPNPDPNPNPDAVFGVIIEERDDRDDLGVKRAMIFENAAIRDDVKDETGQTPSDMKPYIDRARKLGLPAIFLVNKDGKVLFEGAVPQDVATTLALIRQYTEN
jgi:hypothetical protein